MKDKIGFGILGCGVIAPWHANAITKLPETKLIGVCDCDIDKARKFASRKVKFYKKYENMLDDPEIDVISICTPSSMHSIQAIMCATAGKHVIVEKPLATTLEDADRMIEACKKNNVKLTCIFQRRFTEPFITVKKVLEKNSLGKILICDLYMKYYRSQNYYDSADWRGTWKYDGGGVLMNQGIHMIDILCWFMGDVIEVKAECKTLRRKIEVEDTAFAIIKFKNGAEGIIEGTTLAYPDLNHRLEIHGEKGTAIFQGDSISRLCISGKNGKIIEKTEKDLKIKKTILKDGTVLEGHVAQIYDMVRAIKENRDPFISGESARKSLELITAIYKSSKTGKSIKLPLKN